MVETNTYVIRSAVTSWTCFVRSERGSNAVADRMRNLFGKNSFLVVVRSYESPTDWELISRSVSLNPIKTVLLLTQTFVIG